MALFFRYKIKNQSLIWLKKWADADETTMCGTKTTYLSAVLKFTSKIKILRQTQRNLFLNLVDSTAQNSPQNDDDSANGDGDLDTPHWCEAPKIGHILLSSHFDRFLLKILMLSKKTLSVKYRAPPDRSLIYQRVSIGFNCRSLLSSTADLIQNPKVS